VHSKVPLIDANENSKIRHIYAAKNRTLHLIDIHQGKTKVRHIIRVKNLHALEIAIGLKAGGEMRGRWYRPEASYCGIFKTWVDSPRRRRQRPTHIRAFSG
jgi:hypothetical protein